ncbi:MAG TPA: hypothetical protein VIP77_23705 [Jiangellaceae bacterium]
MAYRPYPNADRARRQALRTLLPAQIDLLQWRMRLAAAGHASPIEWRPDFQMDARTGAVEEFPVDEYRLSTRPRIVGGGR